MTCCRSIILLAALALSGCASQAFDYPKQESQALDPSTPTALKSAVEEWQIGHAGPSGFYPLISGRDALAARLKIIEAAQKSIDAQYFLMKGDTAGHIFAGALLDAADRGVRVRFLLDDIFTTVADEELDLLDAHPNVEVRLYNPVSRRGIGLLNFLADYKRANRRMHNKSLTADSQVTIVGGRNIADEYFALRLEGEFLDLDVIGFGPVAADVSRAFDLFWNHERALPIAAISSRFSPAELEAARSEVSEEFATLSDSIYEDVDESPIIRHLLEDSPPLISASGEVVTDFPDKLVSAMGVDQQVLVNRLRNVIDSASSEVIVFTPYLVPGDAGVEFWGSLAARGVRVVIVTNSLASTNHAAVHSGYARYRRPLIEAGVELYEVRADAVARELDGQASAASVTLHTKAILVDKEHVFIGSLNLDPRSIDVNSEMGLLIESAELGGSLAALVRAQLPELAWRVVLDDRGRLLWRGRVDGAAVEKTTEPLASLWRRFTAFVLKIVPDSQL